MLLGILIHSAVKKLVVKPLLSEVERARAYASGRELSLIDTKNMDEIGDLNHALQRIYNELTLEKQQLLETQRDSGVVKHI